MPWTMRRVSLQVRRLVFGAGCLLLLLFFAPDAQAAIERLTIGGIEDIDLIALRDPVDPSENATWAWDSEYTTLTLDGYSGPEISFYSSTGSDTVTVVYAGQNAAQARDGHGLSANCNLRFRAASMSTQDKLTCRGGGSYGVGILAQSGMQGSLTIESGVVAAYGAFPEGARDAGGVGIQAQQVAILEGARVVARGGDGEAAGGAGLYTTGLLELTGRGARLDALGGHSKHTAGDGVICAGGGMRSVNTALYTTGGDGAQPGNGLRHTAGYSFEVVDGYLTATPGKATSGQGTAFGLVTSGNFRVAGGTHLITGGIQSPQMGLVISGGSLRTAAADIVDEDGREVLPTDSLGNAVYLTRPAISGGAWAQIDTIYFRRDPPGGYGTEGVVANGVGRLFLWLPVGTAINGVASGLSEHGIDPPLVTSEDNGARGNIYAVTGEDGQLLATSRDDDGPLTVMNESGTTTGKLVQPANAMQVAEEKTAARPKAQDTQSSQKAGSSDTQKSAQNNASSSSSSSNAQGSGAAAANGSTAGSVNSDAANAAGSNAQGGAQAAAESQGSDAGLPMTTEHTITGPNAAAGDVTPIPGATTADAPTIPGTTVEPRETPGKDDQVPPTGDDGNLYLYIGLLGIALAALTLLRLRKGKAAE